jgi:hypothetical protein
MNSRRIRVFCYSCFLWLVFASSAAQGDGLDLLQRYPTKLTAGDSQPDHARSWEFKTGDIFRLAKFRLEVGKDLHLEVGPADLGIGHCADGAVWAVLIPRDSGTLTSTAAQQEEAVSHVWLRFHPAEINHLFPPETVFADGAANLSAQMRLIANAKITSSWQAGGKAMIPNPKDLTVDVDTKDGPRRFFIVDTLAQTVQYAAAFANQSVRQPPVLTPQLAEAAFDQLWTAFDTNYAMFVLRPEVDWEKLREQYRPQAMASKSTPEFAEICAEMLKPLRDLHVWLSVAGKNVTVFDRLRTANSNPSAHQAILGLLHHEGRAVEWTVTDDKIGFIAIRGWDDPDIPAQCQAALEQMRDTRGLIVDVRLNGGGSEDQAMAFAGRFLKQDSVYAYSQFRNGPNHTNLTEKIERKVAPQGPWRYDRPVVLLIGQKCMSSNESFVGMMTGDPDVTTMGDHTCGSSGNPQIIHLPLEMTVSVPQWIDYLPDGSPLDERGFQPQIPFTPAPGAYEGDRDDLLVAALLRLRQAPLPGKPIAGAVFMTKKEAEAAAVKLDPAIADDCAGQYKNAAGDDIIIRRNGDQFTAQINGANPADLDVEELVAESESNFTSLSSPAIFTFQRDKSGKVTSLARQVQESHLNYAKFAPAPPSLAEADSDKFLGLWEGAFVTHVHEIRWAIRISKTNGFYRATWDVIDHDITDSPFKTLVFTSKSSLFLGDSIGPRRETFRATLNADATEMSGVWKEGDQSLPVTFKRSAPHAGKTQ